MKIFASQHLRCSILAFAIAATLLSSGSFAQTSTQSSSQTEMQPQTSQPGPLATPGHCKSNPAPSLASQPPSCVVKPKKPDTSISLGVFSQLTIDRTQDLFGFAVQSTAPSAGTLGTFRQTFGAWLGYSVNLSYARISERYVNDSAFNIDSNMYESSITYLAHTPVNKHFSLFGDMGPGLLNFLPVHRGVDAINYVPDRRSILVPGEQIRPSGVFGAGVDLHLSSRFDLRAEYRGLVYKNPDFNTGDAPYSKLLTLTSEPTISLVYHFHKSKPQGEFPNRGTPSH